jgi:putative ABC transport system substrate-binding protein
MLTASSERDLDAAFATLIQQRSDALLVNNDAFFSSRANQIVTLAAQHWVPAIYYLRDFVVAGGLVSYGASVADGFPVMQQTRFELVINLKTARALGLNIPATIYAFATEVIE